MRIIKYGNDDIFLGSIWYPLDLTQMTGIFNCDEKLEKLKTIHKILVTYQ